MEGKEELPRPALVVAVAINGKSKSKYIVRWSIEKFLPDGIVNFKLLHVYPRITTVPTPMGNSIPISRVREDVVDAYRKEVEWQASDMLLPYKKMFAQKKVQLDVMIIESNEVANAISEELAKCNINNLVIGASSRGLFSRKLKGLSSKISISAPRLCTVYAISKGKLLSIRPPNILPNDSVKNDTTHTSSSANSSLKSTSSTQSGYGSVSSYSRFDSPSLPTQRYQALSTINQTLINNTRTSSIGGSYSICQSVDMEARKDDGISSNVEKNALSSFSSSNSLAIDNFSQVSDQASSSDVLSRRSCESQNNVNFELEKLRIELRHARGMFALAQKEAFDATRKAHNLSEMRLEEATKLKDIRMKGEAAKELANQAREKSEAAQREAILTKELAEREAMQRREAEATALRDKREKEKLQSALMGALQKYQVFSWEEIVASTSSFSVDLKIGIGAYGTVYKCNLRNTVAAVKVLHSRESKKNKQFMQELEILSKIHHPHLILLLGACPDQGCLVYEYMENGSLEDRLVRKDDTPPIPWFDRFRIAWEVASALVFLHNAKPKPIVHRDLKPTNILLDRNLVSKIGDVGLSRVINSDAFPLSRKETGLVGTLCYIDPEYQRSGEISPESDVYAFGIVILQLLTAKPAMALAYLVENELRDGDLMKILDSEAGNWPVEETKQLAELGLQCAELRRKDRPDLREGVLPVLEKLKMAADRARSSCSSLPSATPNHFICPILKDVMSDPCVASDGYTYDRRAIQKWLREEDKSPMTNLPLPDKNLIPNYTLLSAILEWKSMKS